MTELLPCPFCGGEAKLFHNTQAEDARNWWWIAYCVNEDNCGAGIGGGASEAAAITQWNRRDTNAILSAFYSRVCDRAEANNETLKVALAGLATERAMAAMHDVPDEEL